MIQVNFKGFDFAELDNSEIVVLKAEAMFPIKNYLYKEEDDGDNIYNVSGVSFRYSTLLNAFSNAEKAKTNRTPQLNLPQTLEEAFDKECAIRTRLVIRNRVGSKKKQIYYGTFNICSVEYHQDANVIYELILKEIKLGVEAKDIRERIIKLKNK